MCYGFIVRAQNESLEGIHLVPVDMSVEWVTSIRHPRSHLLPVDLSNHER